MIAYVVSAVGYWIIFGLTVWVFDLGQQQGPTANMTLLTHLAIQVMLGIIAVGTALVALDRTVHAIDMVRGSHD